MKTTLILPIAMLAFGLSSCSNEEYTCVCTNTVTGTTISTTIIEADSQSEAAELCDDRETILTPDQCLIQ